jgi:hypothetical protein
LGVVSEESAFASSSFSGSSLWDTTAGSVPVRVMKVLAAIVVVLLVAATLVADYAWRQWMAARRRDRRE